MTQLDIKNNFLEFIPQEALGLMKPIHYAMLDEMVEHCVNGESLFNGRKPETTQEYNILIGTALVQVIPTFHTFIKEIKDSFPNEELDIRVNYRSEQFKFN